MDHDNRSLAISVVFGYFYATVGVQQSNRCGLSIFVMYPHVEVSTMFFYSRMVTIKGNASFPTATVVKFNSIDIPVRREI